MEGISKKEKIIEVSEQLFLEKGFSNTSVKDITNTLGISKGSFYTYFDSKEALLEEIVKRTLEKIETELLGLQNKSGNKEEILKEFVAMNINLAKEFGPSIVISLRDVALLGENSTKTLSGKIFSMIRNTLSTFIDKVFGAVTNDRVTFLSGIVISIWIQTIFFDDKIDTKSFANMILNGLGG